MYKQPDSTGHFGKFGGRYVPETLMKALFNLEKEYKQISKMKSFKAELNYYLTNYVGRPSPLYFAERLTNRLGGAKIYLKREDLNHTGAHKINNTIGQILLAKRMGKERIIAETGAGMHGVATATVAAMFGLNCTVYMGEEDVRRQALNVYKMKLLGAEVRSVSSGSKTLKDATNEAFRDWMASVEDTFYIIGSVVAAHPYPMIVRDFQSVIGKETRRQILKAENKLPEILIACVGGGSNAMGMFFPFLNDSQVKMIGVEAAGLGISTNHHAATLSCGTIGVFHGSLSYLLQTKEGQIIEPHSISAGLDYPGVGPEHSFLKETGRVIYESVTDKEALLAFHLLTKTEGIIPALESSHAIAFASKIAPKMKKNETIIICLSGRGDKDIDTVRSLEKS